MKERFSKKKIAKDIWDRINQIEKDFKFKSYLGWAQVEGKGEIINRTYGEYECLLSLTDEYDLNT